MSRLVQIAQSLDKAGYRSAVARAASIVYSLKTGGKQSFSVDENGHWINRQPEATVVSPSVHTGDYDAFRAWVLDNWAHFYLPKPGDTVIDVGAGIGEEAIIFSRLVGPSGHVISIEAHPETFACLTKTIAASKLDNVTPLCVAVTDEDGIAFIGTSENHLTSSIVTGGDRLEVPARTLDSLADQLDLGTVALLKMNIEGAERQAVKGMARLATRLAHVCISCHDFLADRSEAEDLRTKSAVRPILESYGFVLSTRPDHPDAWVRDYFYGTNPAVTQP